MDIDQIIEKAIEKLRKNHGDCNCYVCELWRKEREEIIVLLESAKAEMPEPVRQNDNEDFERWWLAFTPAEGHTKKEYRHAWDAGRQVYHLSRKTACDRLDALEKRNRELEAFYAAQSKIAHEAADDNERLQARLDTQRQENKRLKTENLEAYQKGKRDMSDSCKKAISERTNSYNEKMAENKALAERVEELKKYARHDPSCEWFQIGGNCTCGFEQALQEGEKPCTQPNKMVGNKKQ